MTKNTKNIFTATAFVVYLAMVLRLFVFKFTVHLPSGVVLKLGGRGGYGYNVVPFKTILQYLHGHLGMIEIGNLLGNIVLFMPLGFLLPLIFRTLSWKGIFCSAIVFSLCIEILQFALQSGTPDIDDVILNALGGLLGYLVFLFLAKLKRVE